MSSRETENRDLIVAGQCAQCSVILGNFVTYAVSRAIPYIRFYLF